MRTLPRLLVALSLACLLAAGCGSGSDSKKQSTSGSGKPAKKAAPAKVTFAPDQLSNAARDSYIVGSDAARNAVNRFPHTAKTAKPLVNQISPRLKSVLATHPKGASVALDVIVGDHSNKAFLSCSDDPKVAHVYIVTDKEGLSFGTFVTTDTDGAFLIYDYRKAGKKPYDKQGYTTFSGKCSGTTPAPKGILHSDFQLA